MVNADDIRAYLNGHFEWLLIREFDSTFPLTRDEIAIEDGDNKTIFGFLDDNGFHSWRLNTATISENEILLDVAGAFGRKRETIRLVPRVAAAEIAAEVEIARLKVANEIAAMIERTYPGTKLGRGGTACRRRGQRVRAGEAGQGVDASGHGFRRRPIVAADFHPEA